MLVAGLVDIETTGLDSDKDEIIEFAIILFSYDPETGSVTKILDEYTSLREPNCPVTRDAPRIHGLTKRKLKGHNLDHVRITKMIKRADFLVAHNAEFDRGFVEQLFPGARSVPWRCSMNGIDWKAHGFFSKGLQNLLWDHDIVPTEKHRALADAKAPVELLSRKDENGDPYFRELLKSKLLTDSGGAGCCGCLTLTFAVFVVSAAVALAK